MNICVSFSTAAINISGAQKVFEHLSHALKCRSVIALDDKISTQEANKWF